MATVDKLLLGQADHGRALTLDEFRDADEEPGYRFELARGIVEAAEVPDDWHGEIVCNLYRAFAFHRTEHPRVIHRYGGASEFRLWIPGMISGRNPDVAIVLRGAPRDVRGRRIPVLAVEVVSEGGEERDYVTKREEYLVFGLLEYWIVDRTARKVTVLLRDGGVWVERVYQGEQPIASLVLPGFATRVSDLWEDVEDEAETNPKDAEPHA